MLSRYLAAAVLLMADPGADQGTEHGALQVMDVAVESAATRTASGPVVGR